MSDGPFETTVRVGEVVEAAPFHEQYREHRSVEPGFAQRRHVYAVPRILVHAICFGDPYPRRLASTLDGLGY